MAVTQAGRSYRGLNADDRRAERRRRLLDAALELFGTQGYAGTRIKDVCAAAGVTERHFYEAWGSRESLLIDLYDEVVGAHMQRVAAAVAEAPPEQRVGAGVGAAITAWVADPRTARLAFIEIVGVSAQVEARRLATLDLYAQFIATELEQAGAEGDQTWRAHAVLGAVTHCVEMWVHDPSRDLETALPVLTDLFS
jgi:AcrR family transcriptional regulator